MKSPLKAADRMQIASKSWETHNQHASTGHSELRMLECYTEIGQIFIEWMKVPNMLVRPACLNAAYVLEE